MSHRPGRGVAGPELESGILMKRLLVAVTAAAATLALAVPAHAITDGVPDQAEHPMVGQLLFYVPTEVDSRFSDPGAWFNCTGTLINATTVLTAGHCTEGIGDEGDEPDSPLNGGGDVWFSTLEVPDYDMLPSSSGFVPDRNGKRYDAWAAALDDSDTWHQASESFAHPKFLDAAFLYHDVGIVTLSEPIELKQYGKLPGLKHLDQYAKSTKSTGSFETVGYGLEASGPKTASGGDTRRKAEGRRLVSLYGAHGLRDIAATFTHSAAQGGGSCFGDSGGPTFDTSPGQDGLTVVTVTSFGMSSTCTAGGYYRIDQEDDLAFIGEHD
jgi:hypothetical protein